MQVDKILHAIGGAGIAAVVLLVTQSVAYAMVCAALAGAIKEAYDATGRGNVELADFIATVAGGALMCIALEIFVRAA